MQNIRQQTSDIIVNIDLFRYKIILEDSSSHRNCTTLKMAIFLFKFSNKQ